MSEKKCFSTKKKILWVDDDINKPALEPDRDELQERNCTIVPITRPDDFLEIINGGNDSNVDCLLIDTMMPNGKELSSIETDNTTRTGLALIKRLFESDNYKNIPIIVYSVVDEDVIWEYCNENGISLDRITILNKSMKSSDFANTVVDCTNTK